MGELSDRIRAKYPGAYDSLSDSDLEAKVVARYPGVYDHLVGRYEGDRSGRSVADMQKEFIKREGTLKTRMANTSLKDAAYNAVMEVPRLAQEMVTVPVNSAIKGAAGIGGLAKVGGELYRGKSLDEALQAGTQVINARPQVSGPMDSSVVGETIGAGVEQVNKALPDNMAGDIGRAGLEAGMDIAGLIGGGKALKQTGKLATDLGAKGVIKGIGNKPERLMESTLKQSTVLSEATRARNVQTALEGEYIPNKKGSAKLQGDIEGINSQIAQVIDDAKQAGDTISVDAVATRLDGLKQKANATPMWKENNAAIDKVIDGLKTNPNVVNGQLPVEIAQQMKVKIGQDVKYGQFTNFEGEGLKGIARGLKEELAAKFPELAEPNAKDSALYSLQKQLDRAVSRIGNRDTIGIGPSVKIAAGATAGGVGAAIGALTALIEHPSVAPRLAIQMHKARKGAISRTQAMIDAKARIKNIVNDMRLAVLGTGGQPNE